MKTIKTFYITYQNQKDNLNRTLLFWIKAYNFKCILFKDSFIIVNFYFNWILNKLKSGYIKISQLKDISSLCHTLAHKNL